MKTDSQAREFTLKTEDMGPYFVTLHVQTVATYQWTEKSRIYAEAQMPENWDRKDHINLGIFYGHMLRFIADNYGLIQKDLI